MDEQLGSEEETQTVPKNYIKKYILAGSFAIAGALLVTGILIAFAVLQQTKTVTGKLDVLQIATGKVLDRLAVNQNDPLSVFKVTESQEIVIPQNAPSLGSPNAPVTVVEYEDFQCPFCHQFFDTVFPSLQADYIDTGTVKFIHANFAFLGAESITAAEASLCAQDQNKFWEYRRAVFDNQGEENAGIFTEAKLISLAKSTGLEETKFSECIHAHTYKNLVETQTEQGRSNGVSATPTFFVNGKRVEGALEYKDFKRILDYALEQK